MSDDRDSREITRSFEEAVFAFKVAWWDFVETVKAELRRR